MTEATIVIKGRNELSYAVKQAENSLRGLLRQGELIKKAFTGGAVLGAALAFERLAQNAEQAAIKIGDRGTAKALGQLNKEIDNLKAKGLNVIGRVLGDTYIAAAGSEVQKLEVRVRNLREQLQLLDSGGTRGGRAGFELGALSAANVEAQLRRAQADLAAARLADPNGALAPLGSAARTRALSRGGGSGQLVQTLPPEVAKVPKGPKADGVLWVDTDRIILAERAWMELGDTINQSMSGIGDDLSQWSGETFEALTQPVEMAATVWDAYAEQGARNIQDAFARFLFDPFEDGLRGMAQGFVDAIRQMLAQYLAFTTITGIGTALGNANSPFLNSIGNFLSGKRALGGPVTAGGAYLVGEAGPELFVPRSSGQIVPNGAMGGVTMNYTIDARGADADRIMAVLPPLLRQTEQRTVARVQELLQRGRLA